MKRYLTTIFIIFIAFGYSYSQVDYQISSALDFFRANQLTSGDFKNQLTESDIKGSPYLNDEFINGTVFTTSKFQFVDVPLRYNIFNDNLEFKTPDDKIMAMAAPEIVERVEFGEYTMAYIPYSNVKKIRRGFFQILEEGPASLFARSLVLFQEPLEPGAYKEAEPAKFLKKPDSYYIRIGMEQAQKVGNKKELLEIFPDHKNEIATFIKKNKVKPTKSESLKKLVQYYNSL